MNIVSDRKSVLSVIKGEHKPCTMAKVLKETSLSHKRVRDSLYSLHVSGDISPGGRGAWVAIEKRPTKHDIFIGLFLMFVFGVGCGYGWHYMAVS